MLLPSPAPLQPTKPALEPTRPSLDPTQPILEPTNPALDPTQPVLEPTKPALDPTQPVLDPTQPVIEPTKPALDPTKPSLVPVEEEGDTSSVRVGFLVFMLLVLMFNLGVTAFWAVYAWRTCCSYKEEEVDFVSTSSPSPVVFGGREMDAKTKESSQLFSSSLGLKDSYNTDFDNPFLDEGEGDDPFVSFPGVAGLGRGSSGGGGGGGGSGGVPPVMELYAGLRSGRFVKEDFEEEDGEDGKEEGEEEEGVELRELSEDEGEYGENCILCKQSVTK